MEENLKKCSCPDQKIGIFEVDVELEPFFVENSNKNAITVFLLADEQKKTVFFIVEKNIIPPIIWLDILPQFLNKIEYFSDTENP